MKGACGAPAPKPMLTRTGRETAIQSVLNHKFKTSPGVPPQCRALDDASVDAPGQARNRVNRDAGGQYVRGSPGFGQRHRGRSRDTGGGRGRISLIPWRGRSALGQAVPAAYSIFVSTAKGRAFLPGLNAGTSSAKFR